MSEQKPTSHVTLFEKRCTNCNALLGKISLQQGIVELKCKCGTINTFSASVKNIKLQTAKELQQARKTN